MARINLVLDKHTGKIEKRRKNIRRWVNPEHSHVKKNFYSGHNSVPIVPYEPLSISLWLFCVVYFCMYHLSVVYSCCYCRIKILNKLPLNTLTYENDGKLAIKFMIVCSTFSHRLFILPCFPLMYLLYSLHTDLRPWSAPIPYHMNES